MIEQYTLLMANGQIPYIVLDWLHNYHAEIITYLH